MNSRESIRIILENGIELKGFSFGYPESVSGKLFSIQQ